jgi:Anti-sigma factor NepR
MGGVLLLRDCKHFPSSRESAESAKLRRRHDRKGNSVTSKAGFSGWSADECVTARLAEAGGRRGRSESKKELERWFGEQLARLYGEILAEPLPDELADLVEKLRRDKKSSVWDADLNRGSNFPEAP